MDFLVGAPIKELQDIGDVGFEEERQPAARVLLQSTASVLSFLRGVLEMRALSVSFIAQPPRESARTLP